MEEVSPQQGYKMLHKFLEIYQELGTETDDLKKLLKRLEVEDDQPVDPTLWKLWMSYIEKIETSHDAYSNVRKG